MPDLSSVLAILTAISGYSVLIPFLFCVVLYKQIPAQFRYIMYFVFIATVGETVARTLFTLRINGLPALHTYTLAEGIVLLLLYRQFFGARFKSIYFTIVISVFSLFVIVNAMFFQSIFEVNSNARSLEAVLIIGCSILYYFFLFESEDTVYLKKPLLWINSGIFLYFSMSLLFFLFGNYLIQNYTAKLNNIVWRLHTIFLIVFHLILTRGIWLLGKKTAF